MCSRSGGGELGEGSRQRDPGSSSHVICNFGPKNLQGRNVSKIHFQWDRPRSQSLNDATGRCLYRYRTFGAGTPQTTALEIAGANWKQTSRPGHSSVVVSNSTTVELTGAGFVLDLHDVLITTYRTVLRRQSVVSARCESGVVSVTVWCFLSLCGSASWEVEGVSTGDYAPGQCVSMSSHEHACDGSISQHPLVRCIASPAGSGDTGDNHLDGPDGMHSCMQRLWGFRSRSLGGASGIPPPGNMRATTACQEGVDDSMGWTRTPSRDCSVPCRLLHETPAHVQGRNGGRVAGEVVRLCNPPGALCTDVWKDGPPW